MKSLVASVTIAIVTGWLGLVLGRLILPLPLAIIAGIALGVLSVTWLRHGLALKSCTGLMEPMGIVLPVLALRHVAQLLGFDTGMFATAELVLFVLAYMAFLATTFGYLRGDAYRLGYAPLPVGIMVLGVCVYGAMREDITLPLIAVLAQLFWIRGWGSSNWFDHVLHVALLPLVILQLGVRFM